MVGVLCKNVDMTNGKDRVEQTAKAEWNVFGKRHIYENHWVNLALDRAHPRESWNKFQLSMNAAIRAGSQQVPIRLV